MENERDLPPLPSDPHLVAVISTTHRPNPTAPSGAGERLPAAPLAQMGSGVRTAPHRGDTGYSAEKAAALPPAQLSNCHQQWPPRLAFSIYFPESQLSSSLSTMDLFSRSTLASICSEQAPCTQASFPIQTSTLDLQIPKVLVPGDTSHCLCPWPQLTRWIWHTGSCSTFLQPSFLLPSSPFLPIKNS